MTPEQDFAGRDFVGGRESQQDFYAFAELEWGSDGGAPGLLAALADGMGGYKGGDRASRVAVQAFVQKVRAAEGSGPARLEAGLAAANDAILHEAQANPEDFGGMGTTLVAFAVAPGGLEWISVGDSALLLFRAGELHRLNEDHSLRTWFEQQVTDGRLTQEQADADPLRSRLRSAIMGSEIALVDVSREAYPLQKGDIIVAATDGLETLDRASLGILLQATRNASAGQIADAMVRAVMERRRPRQDNTTVAVVKVPNSWFTATK